MELGKLNIIKIRFDIDSSSLKLENKTQLVIQNNFIPSLNSRFVKEYPDHDFFYLESSWKLYVMNGNEEVLGLLYESQSLVKKFGTESEGRAQMISTFDEVLDVIIVDLVSKFPEIDANELIRFDLIPRVDDLLEEIKECNLNVFLPE